MIETTECSETVSIVEAVLLGADGACVDIGIASLLAGVALFVSMVVALHFLGITILRRIFPSLRRESGIPAKKIEQKGDGELQRLPYESPIRSTGAWGNKAR